MEAKQDKSNEAQPGQLRQASVRRGFLSSMAYMHSFFVHESPRYMLGVKNVAYYAGYPRAYVRFMWYSLRDYFLWRVHNRA